MSAAERESHRLNVHMQRRPLLGFFRSTRCVKGSVVILSAATFCLAYCSPCMERNEYRRHRPFSQSSHVAIVRGQPPRPMVSGVQTDACEGHICYIPDHHTHLHRATPHESRPSPILTAVDGLPDDLKKRVEVALYPS